MASESKPTGKSEGRETHVIGTLRWQYRSVRSALRLMGRCELDSFDVPRDLLRLRIEAAGTS